MMKILLLDNYDSFTYNLVHYVEAITGEKPTVVLNNMVELSEVEKFDAIILSPGPGLPIESGKMPALVEQYASHKPMLGVCLGHQAIAESFGGKIFNTQNIIHGMAREVYLTENESVLFKGIPRTFTAGRYHSWAVDRSSLPEEFEITAIDAEGLIMAMQHKHLPLQSVQFHPESILTPHGMDIMRNWLETVQSQLTLPANII